MGRPDHLMQGVKIPQRAEVQTSDPLKPHLSWAINTTLKQFNPPPWGKEFFMANVFDQPLKTPAAQQYANQIIKESIKLGGFTDEVLRDLPPDLKTPDLEIKLRNLENDLIDLFTRDIERTGQINPRSISAQTFTEEDQFFPEGVPASTPVATRPSQPTRVAGHAFSAGSPQIDVNQLMKLGDAIRQGNLARTPQGDFYNFQEFLLATQPISNIDLKIDTTAQVPESIKKLNPPDDPTTYLFLSQWGNMHLSMKDLNPETIRNLEQKFEEAKKVDPSLKKSSLFAYYLSNARPITDEQLRRLIQEQWKQGRNIPFVQFINNRQQQKPVWIRVINDPFEGPDTMGLVVTNLVNAQKEAIKNANAQGSQKSPVRWQAVQIPLPTTKSTVYLLIPTFLQSDGSYKPYYVQFGNNNPYMYHIQFDNAAQVASTASMIIHQNRWQRPSSIGINGRDIKNDIAKLVDYLNKNQVLIGPHWIKAI
jgi:hypothetical protein